MVENVLCVNAPGYTYKTISMCIIMKAEYILYHCNKSYL